VKLDVRIVQLRSRLLAAVRRTAAPRDIPAVCRPALEVVWAFMEPHRGLRLGEHNLALYQHVDRPALGMPVDFGVEVVRPFEPEGEVRCVETPAGKAVTTLHVGPYTGLPLVHAALHVWCRKNGHRIGAQSLEVYENWSEDPSKLETTVAYMLRAPVN
jgi:hypothetical protein